jgi:antitoxin component HigA of HigAB toxin-antitoxin module
MGNKGHESLVLAGKREITLKMAQRLREYFQLPAELYFGLRYSIVVIQGNGLNE